MPVPKSFEDINISINPLIIDTENALTKLIPTEIEEMKITRELISNNVKNAETLPN